MPQINNAEIVSLINSKEITYQLPEGLLYGLVYTESRGNPRAYNEQTGASGLTQIISRYHPGAGENLFDAESNLDYAARTIKRYAENFGSYAAAVAAWHSGEGRVSNSLAKGGDGIPGTKDSVTGISTRSYVDRVLSFAGTNVYNPVQAERGGSLQTRPFNRASLATIGLGFVLLGALVVASKG